MKIARRLTQALFLFLFLFLFFKTESTGDDELRYPVRIFLDFDPLLLISTILSTHTLKDGFYFALILVAMTFILGRFFCGWVCPLGTLNDAAGGLARNKPEPTLRHWASIKYGILAFILASSLLGLQVSGILDPLALLIRSLTLGVQPALEYSLRSFFDTIYRLDPPLITALSESIYGMLRAHILAFNQPYFAQGFFISLILAAVLLLNLVARRFWCRYLCPLGALLGLCSRKALVSRKVSEGCLSCGVCQRICPSGAVCSEKGTSDPAECLLCLECLDSCSEKAISFGFRRRGPLPPLNVGRRTVIASVAGGLIVTPFLRIGLPAKASAPPGELIRPPGALREPDFLSACVRCEQCMKVCITNGLQPTFLQAGLEGIWTPMLVPRIGPCEFRCTLCGQVCPTGAIRRLAPAEKETIKIGMAVIDRGRCLPWANGLQCSVCEEVCPTPKKAIYLQDAVWTDREGNREELKQPLVDLERCVGCGACEYHCPVAGKPAIYVISTGESREPDNQVLL